MPGRLFLEVGGQAVADEMGQRADHVADQLPRHNIAPGQQVITRSPGGLFLMRWGIIPVGRVNARGRPVMETLVNARSETVFDKSAFDGVGRAVVPVHGWYEWTGEARRKTPWRISRKDGELLMIAAITDHWIGPGGISVAQVATVTCPPNTDVAGIHHRMGVILHPDDVRLWLNGTVQEATSLMTPLQNGVLHIEKARGVDWNGP